MIVGNDGPTKLHDGRSERGNSVPNHEGTGRMSLPACKQLAPTTTTSAVPVKAT